MDREIHIGDLVLRLADNRITPEELGELERLLVADPEAVEFSSELLMELHLIRTECKPLLLSGSAAIELSGSFDRDVWECMAKYEKEAPGIELERAIAEPEKIVLQRGVGENAVRKINKVSLFTAVASLAALLLLLAYPRFVPVFPSPPVGRISRVLDAQWADSSGSIREGSDLYPGVMKLTRGLAELTFESGAQVVVEAPVEFELESSSQIFLKMGRLAATIHNTADKFFVVRTSNAAVVDFGTEFGVSFGNGQTQAYVFEGEVELRNSSNLLRYEKGLPLREGQGGQVDSDGVLSSNSSHSGVFVRSEEFDAKLKASKGSGYHQWLAYSYALRRDPSLAVYYTFEKDPSAPETFANLSAATAGRLNSSFESLQDSRKPVWTSGRWPEKTALRFDRASRQYSSVSSDAAIALNGPVTLAAWLKCPDITDGGHIISNRMLNGGACNYQLGYRTSSLRDAQNCLHIARKKETDDWANHLFGRPLEPSSNWMMIAVTHDNQTASFYCNGQLIESRPWRHQQDVIAADLWIGTDGTTNDAFYFNGLIDEIAIFKRALSAAEIQRMYDSGKP